MKDGEKDPEVFSVTTEFSPDGATLDNGFHQYF